MVFRVGFLLLAVAACSDSVAPPAAALDAGADSGVDALADSGVDAILEAAAPEVSDDCVLVPSPVPAAEDECDPCKGRTFSAGASCADLTTGAQCEVGTHPSWHCNDVWECDANHQWKHLVVADTSAICQPNVVVGWGCNPHYGGCPHPTGVACLDTTKSEICLFADPWSAAGSQCLFIYPKHTRFGCPCEHDDVGICSYIEKCVSGRWQLAFTQPCPGP